MKARLFVIPFLVAGLALLLAWTVAAQGTGTRVHTQSNPSAMSIRENCPDCENAVSLSYHISITSTQSFTVYLPLVQRSTLPCTVAPTLISPTNGSALDTLVPLLVYMRGTHPVSYTVISIADNPTFDTPIKYSSSGGALGPHQLRLFYNLEPATTYYWHVYDVCGSVNSPHSSVFSFTTGSGGVILPAPALVSPADGTVGIGQETTLVWDAVGGAVGYELFRCREGGGCWLYFTSSTSQEVRYLNPNTTYEWYVKAYNDYAYGNQSDIWRFTTGSFTSLREDVTGLHQLEVLYTLYHLAEQTPHVIEYRR